MKPSHIVVATAIAFAVVASDAIAQGTKVTVNRWETIRHWVVNDRPATQKRVGNNWVGVPGTENPRPGVDYRLAIAWGPRNRARGTGNWLEHVQLRVVFDGWRRGGNTRYQNSIQFYIDSTFSQPTSPQYRVHIDQPLTQIFHPDRVGIIEYAYFRVTTARDRAWRMRYNIGLYGSVYQRSWRKVRAR